MSSRILVKLNHEHVMGDSGPWTEFARWDNEHGEMGVYFSDGSPFLRELAYLIVLSDEEWYDHQYSVRAIDVLMHDAQAIAKFAGAELKTCLHKMQVSGTEQRSTIFIEHRRCCYCGFEDQRTFENQMHISKPRRKQVR